MKPRTLVGVTRVKNRETARKCATVRAGVADWIGEIKRIWARGPASALELARVVCAAKRQLRHGEWQELWKSLPFSRRKADMLATIGNGFGWANRQTFAHLPPGWSILYHLARVDRTTLEDWIRDGVVHPALKLWEAKKLLAQFLGTTINVNSSKPRVRQRLRRFEDFVRVTLPDWSDEERTIAKQALARLREQIGDAAVFEHDGHARVFQPGILTHRQPYL